jgi:hypothetical protein
MDTTKDGAPFDADASRIDVRRRVLLWAPGLMALGSLAAVSLGQSMPAWAQTQSGSVKDDINILNVALGLEYQAIAAYQVGAESGLLQKPVLDTAVKFQGHHKAHAQVLAGTVSKMGGTPVMTKKTAEYNFPVSQLKTRAGKRRHLGLPRRDAEFLHARADEGGRQHPRR